MKSNQITFVFLAFIAILGWNAFLTQRDAQLFDAYDKVCSTSDCRYSK